MPTVSSSTVMVSTTLVCSENRRNRRFCAMFSITTNPSPPQIVSAEVSSSMGTWFRYTARLLPPIRSKPALLNAETEWNTLSHTAFPTG